MYENVGELEGQYIVLWGIVKVLEYDWKGGALYLLFYCGC